MKKSKVKIDKRMRKFSLLMSLEGKSDNEVAAILKERKESALHKAKWAGLRKIVLSAFGSRCMCCGYISGKYPPNVDHIKPRKYYPDLALSIENLQVLCAGCNKAKGNKHMTDYRTDYQKELSASLAVTTQLV